METGISILIISITIILAIAGLGFISLFLLAIFGSLADENEKLENQ